MYFFKWLGVLASYPSPTALSMWLSTTIRTQTCLPPMPKSFEFDLSPQGHTATYFWEPHNWHKIAVRRKVCNSDHYFPNVAGWLESFEMLHKNTDCPHPLQATFCVGLRWGPEICIFTYFQWFWPSLGLLFTEKEKTRAGPVMKRLSGAWIWINRI